MIRMYAMYRALKVFVYIGTVLSVIGILPILRFLLFYFRGEGAGHIQSLILGGAFLGMGFIAYLVGLVADLISNNRQLVEMTLERAKRAELDRLKVKNQSKDD
jgi:multisubunit Na+/H+ antiporter MnhG subunit